MDNYTGIWIPERDHFPFAIVACEHLSDDAESSFSTLECSSIDPWKEIVFIVYIVYDDWIVKRTNVITNEPSDVIGKYNVDGEIEWFGGFTNDTKRRGKWRRPSARDYIGVWEQVSELSKEFSNIYCKHLSEDQLECILRNFEREKRLTYTVHETSITSNANSSLQGKFNSDGSITWFLDTNHFLTWKRKGKFYKYLLNRAI